MSGSATPSLLVENLAGALDIMLGRQSGLSRIDLSSHGFAWSFSGLVLAGLIDTSVLSMLYDERVAQAVQVAQSGIAASSVVEVGRLYFLLGHLLVALFSYGASMAALYLLCRLPAEQQRFPVAIVVHNWASAIVSLSFVPIVMIGIYFGGDPHPENGSPLVNLLSVFWIGVLIFVGLRLMRISLDLKPGKSVLFFTATSAVSIVASETIKPIFGLNF